MVSGSPESVAVSGSPELESSKSTSGSALPEQEAAVKADKISHRTGMESREVLAVPEESFSVVGALLPHHLDP